MNGNTVAELNGKIEALNLVLIQLITTLTPVQAAQMAAGVAIDRHSIRDLVDYATPEATISIQENLLDGYLGLLTALAKRG